MWQSKANITTFLDEAVRKLQFKHTHYLSD